MLDMLDADEAIADPPLRPIVSRSSRWVRARQSGIALMWVELGSQVARGQAIGQLHDSFGRRLSQLKASADGVVIGMSRDPIVNQGDAIAHIASIEPEIQ